jgi:hypothetical protein
VEELGANDAWSVALSTPLFRSDIVTPGPVRWKMGNPAGSPIGPESCTV